MDSTATLARASTRTPASRLHLLGESLSGAGWIAATTLLYPFVRGWASRWGATLPEAGKPLPGDELVPAPRIQSTRAITIEAPPDIVWGWVVQIGQERGGLYSYEGLENLIGSDMHNADRVDPAMQLKVADRVRLGPKGYPLFVVLALEPSHSLVMAGADLKTEAPVRWAEPMPPAFACSSWALVLAKLPNGHTRLFSRNRLDFGPPNLANRLMWGLAAGPIGFVMERKMLLGIRERAERGLQPTDQKRSTPPPEEG